MSAAPSPDKGSGIVALRRKAKFAYLYWPVLKEYLGLVEDQLDEPFVFAPFHEAWTEENDSPHDHLAMDTAFMEPMLDPNDSVLLGSERVKDIEALLAKGEAAEADAAAWAREARRLVCHRRVWRQRRRMAVRRARREL